MLQPSQVQPHSSCLIIRLPIGLTCHQFQIRSVTCARWTRCRNIERAAGFRHHELSIECTNAKRSPGRRHHRLNKTLPKAQPESAVATVTAQTSQEQANY